MAQGQQTTMKRIASELGVSVTTISKVLNNHGDISEATRDRVMAKIEELGYQRNAVARSLTLRRTHTIGIVIPDLMHSFFVEVIAGIEPIASVAKNVTGWSDTGLSPQTSYTYRVRAFNAAGYSTYSNEASVTTAHSSVSGMKTAPIPSDVSSIGGSTSSAYDPPTGSRASRSSPAIETSIPTSAMGRTPIFGAYFDARPAETMIPPVNGRKASPALSGP